jgi:dihydroorotate dehydrogenase electron transfer subunit
MQIETGTVVRHESAGGHYRVLSLDLPGVASQASPGQFVHLRVASLQDAVLRRPFSIYRVDGNTLSILYKNVGRGTQAMQSMSVGTSVNVIGPLGNGFPTVLTGESLPVLVAGGYGVAPLYFLATRLNRRGVIFIGGATAQDILLASEFQSLQWDVCIATEDGSLGTRGRVTTPLDTWLKTSDLAARPEFFACGPNGMLKALADRANQGGWHAWLSLDRHMGCGVGACLACVQRVTHDGEDILVRVCKEGPIFDSRTIVWEERQ